MKERTATIEGIAMRWREQRQGMPVALIHGVLTSPLLWRHVIPRIQHAHHQGAASLIQQIEALDVNDMLSIADALPSLNLPARIVWGVKDRFLKIQYGERFSRDLNAPLYRIKEGLHFTPEDHPEVVAEQLNLLIDEVRHSLPPSHA